jgi:hypothetical protein
VCFAPDFGRVVLPGIEENGSSFSIQVMKPENSFGGDSERGEENE